jgi:transcriptional regulator with XRE-family HTH domain
MRLTKNLQWGRSLQNLRKIIDKNQEQFAELVGVSTSLIKSVECGRASFTRKLGTKIQIATGATIGESRVAAKGFGPYEPLKGNAVISKWTRRGPVPFTRADFEDHLTSRRPERIDDMVDLLKKLVKAADQPGHRRGKLLGLRCSFREWAQEAIERFKLTLPASPAPSLPVRPLRDDSESSRPRRRRA